METAIRTTIDAYITGISQKDIPALDHLLNDHFKVMQVVENSLRVLSKKEYLQLFKENKAGGDRYQVEDLQISYVGPAAMASYTLHGEVTHMHVFLQLMETTAGHWEIVNNMPVVTACAH